MFSGKITIFEGHIPEIFYIAVWRIWIETVKEIDEAEKTESAKNDGEKGIHDWS